MLRGIAAMMVCLFHFTGTLNNPFWHNEVGFYGKFGVHIFFVISGFIIPYSMYKSNYKLKNFWKFMLKRIIRIEPVYLFSICLIIIISYVAKLSPYSLNSNLDYFNLNSFLHLLYLVDFFNGHWLNPVFWTLAIEFQFYILIAFLFSFLQNTNKLITLFILFFGCALPFLLKVDFLVFNYLLLFIPGYLFYLFYIQKLTLDFFILFLLLTAILNWVKFDFYVAICPLISISFIYFVKKPKRILMFLGKISFSIYLLHTPIGTDRIINFCQNFIVDGVGRTFLMFATIPLLILISWIFYKYIEAPAINFSKKIIFK